MDLSFVEYKDLSYLESSFEVGFGSNNVLVYVWNSIAGLKRNTNFNLKEYFGAYVVYPHRRKKGLVGEIHFVIGHITNEVVAHEVQHFILDMISFLVMDDNERIAILAGEITGHILNRFRLEAK